jgi:hypothetical protein
MTHFSFWIEPDAGQDYRILVQLQDDDDGDDFIPASPNGGDDEFQYDVTVNASGGDVMPGGGWQRVSIPLADFFDDNSYHYGGNGVFDPYLSGNGRLINIAFSLVSVSGADVSFRTDRWEFTREEGALEGAVWRDTDGDGLRESGEPGEDGVTVRLLDGGANVVATTSTAGDGSFAFAELPAGEYEVEVDTTGGLGSASPTADPDGIATANRAWVAADCSGVLADLDFGYEAGSVSVPGPVPVSGTVLGAGAPNPFTSSTTLSFTLDRGGPVTLTVHDVAGRAVRRLVDADLPAGAHTAVWDGRSDAGVAVAGGLYLVVLDADSQTAARRVLRLP